MHPLKHSSLVRLVTAMILALILASGCNEGPPERIEAENFDQSCQMARDCARVDERTCMKCGGTGTAAINKDALDEFEQAQDAVDCDELSMDGCNNNTAAPYLTCQQSTCGLWTFDDPEGLADQISGSCTEDSDCVPIKSREPVICTYDTCECPDRAVNRQAWETILVASCDAQSPHADCNETTACDDRKSAVCEQGRCVLAP